MMGAIWKVTFGLGVATAGAAAVAAAAVGPDVEAGGAAAGVAAPGREDPGELSRSWPEPEPDIGGWDGTKKIALTPTTASRITARPPLSTAAHLRNGFWAGGAASAPEGVGGGRICDMAGSLWCWSAGGWLGQPPCDGLSESAVSGGSGVEQFLPGSVFLCRTDERSWQDGVDEGLRIAGTMA